MLVYSYKTRGCFYMLFGHPILAFMLFYVTYVFTSLAERTKTSYILFTATTSTGTATAATAITDHASQWGHCKAETISQKWT